MAVLVCRPKNPWTANLLSAQVPQFLNSVQSLQARLRAKLVQVGNNAFQQ